jgi:hypothetical protein
VICKGSGLVDGHPRFLSSYRLETSGIVAVLYILERICTYYNITGGSAICYCDISGAVNNIYMTNHRGISKFLDSDYDMVHLVQTLLHSIQIQVYSEWVKGHYTPKKMELKYIINHLADDQAMVFLSTPHLGYTPCHMPMTYPGFGIHLHYENSIMLSGLYKTLSSALHD